MSSPTYCTTEPATIAPNQGRKSPQPPGLGQRAEPRDTQPSSLPCAEAGVTTAQRLSPLRGVPRSHQAECSRERREEPLSEPRGKQETRTVRSPRATRSARPSSSLRPAGGRCVRGRRSGSHSPTGRVRVWSLRPSPASW